MSVVNYKTPPNFDEIARVMPGASGDGVVFAHHPDIYVPDGRALPPWILAHEQVHLDRQAGQVEAWWERYLADGMFRLDEEVLAHRAEWHAFRASNRDREQRNAMLIHIARKLASPLYGRLLTIAQAKWELQA